ncbi:MAG TPA: septum site-determining protein MinC [Kofleriaceae bacterium]
MDSSNAALIEPEVVAGPPALLRGTARGLEWFIDGRADAQAIVGALEAKLGEAPAFFRGSNVRVAIESGPLANGKLLELLALAEKYDLHVIEIGPLKVAPAIVTAPAVESVPEASLAEGSAPAVVEPMPVPAPVSMMPAPEPVVVVQSEQTRLFVGPVRSGVILDHVGNLIVFGDVNPGAEVRATGNIVVLGRLKGTAHAAIGSDTGFILALRLEPQQLRIGRRVARAADNDTSSNDAEIAYATGDQMIVERYKGLPRNLTGCI